MPVSFETMMARLPQERQQRIRTLADQLATEQESLYLPPILPEKSTNTMQEDDHVRLS